MTTEKQKANQMKWIVFLSLSVIVLLGLSFWKQHKARKAIVPIKEPVNVDGTVYQHIIPSLQDELANKKALIASWDGGRDTIILRGRNIIKTVYVDTTDAFRGKLLWFNAELDDTIVHLPTPQLINFRLAQNYMARGELRICDIQLKTARLAMEDYETLVYYDSIQISKLGLGVSENALAYKQCKEISDALAKDLKKETKNKNIWRVSALIAGMTTALFIVK